MSEIDLKSLSARERYGFMTSVIVPRPIAWVSTQNEKGVSNLAPFSYFSGISSDPAMVSISIARRPDGSLKDTFANMQTSGVFCVNLVEEHQAEAMNITSGSFAPGVSEFEKAGVLESPCKVIDCVRVVGARVALECRFVEAHTYAKGDVNLCIGEVLHAYIDDAITDEKGRADAALISPVARLGAGNYTRLGERFVLKRPKV